MEVRLDLLPGDGMKILREVREVTPLPIIATNRWAAEGGAFRGEEDKRIEILAEASAWADLVDVELLAEGRDRLPGDGGEADDNLLPQLPGHAGDRGDGVDPQRGLRGRGRDLQARPHPPPPWRICLDLLKLLLRRAGPHIPPGDGRCREASAGPGTDIRLSPHLRLHRNPKGPWPDPR